MDDARPPPVTVEDKPTRNFFLVSYCSFEFLESLLYSKREVIAHYAYALHDMDKFEDGRLKEPHIHILLKLHNALNKSTVLNWFENAFDDKNEKCNTFIDEVRKDFGYCFRYLWHGNQADKKKFQYSFDRVHCDDVSYFKKYQLESQLYEDKLLHAVQDLLAGATFTSCVYKYGRDFIIHEKQVMACVRRMHNEIGSTKLLLSNLYDLNNEKGEIEK